MPKSKHRRKPKKTAEQSASTGVDLSVDVANESDTGAPAASAKTKKSSTSPLQFFRQVRDEAQKITWTSRNETMVSTIMVLIMVAIASVFFLLVDQILRFIIPLILNLSI